MRHVGVPTRFAFVILGVLFSSCSNSAYKTVMAAGDHSDPFESVPPLQSGPEVYLLDSDSNATWTLTGRAGNILAGGVDSLAGSIEVPGDDFSSAAIAFHMDLGSLYSDHRGITDYMKGPTFFHTTQYPVATFASTRVIDNDMGFEVTGMLTMHGKSKNITFPAQVEIDGNTLTSQVELLFRCSDFDIAVGTDAFKNMKDEMRLHIAVKATRP